MLRILLSQQDEKALTRLFGFFEKWRDRVTLRLRICYALPFSGPWYTSLSKTESFKSIPRKRHANLSIQRDSFETVDDDSQVDSVDCRFAVGESLEGPGDRTG